MKIISMLTYWGQITNGSVVYIATKRGIREGTVVAMRCVTEWPLLRCDGRFDEHPIVDLDLGADERVLNVPLSELHPNQWMAQSVYVQSLVQNERCVKNWQKQRRSEVIGNEQVKIGQTIWFESRGKIESGPVYGACGVNMWHIKIDGALIPFSIWGLYPTKSACVRAKLERADAELNSLNERCVELERLCGDLAAQIKEEEKERAANAVGKAHPVRWVNSRFGELVLVQLPRCIEAGVKDRKEESPVVVRTDHVLLQYEYGCIPNSDGSLTHNGLVIIYPADKLGRIVSVKDMPWKSIHVDRHPRNYGVTVDDTRAAVESLGFELED